MSASIVPLVVLAASLLGTIAAAWVLRRTAEDRDIARFDAIVSARRDRVMSRIEAYVQTLVATSEFVACDEELTDDEFTRFVDRLEFGSRYWGTIGIAYSRTVPRARRAELERELTATHGTAVALRPENDGPLCSAVLHVAPPTADLRTLLGWDMTTEPVRREAVRRAVERSSPAITPPVRLAQANAGPRPGFVVIVPVWEPRSDAPDAVGRGRTLRGFVSGAVDCDQFLEGVMESVEREASIAIFVGAKPPDAEPDASTEAAGSAAPRFQTETTFAIAGAPWRLRIATRPGFDDDSRVGQSRIVLLVGVVLSVALALLTVGEVASRVRAERASEDALRSREALRRTEEQFRQMAETIDDVFWVTDAGDGRFVYVSPKFATMFDAPGAAVAEASETWASRLHPHDRRRVLRAVESRAAGGAYDETYRIVTRDGGVRWIHDRAYAVRDASGRVLRTIGIAQDVSEARAADAALRTSEERFREITENLREVVWVTGADGRTLLYVSENFESVWGRDRGVLAERPEAWIELIHPEDRDHVVAALPRMLDGTFDVLYRIVPAEGAVRWIHHRASVVRDGTGAVVRVVATSADVTELHEANETLRRQADRLRQAQKMEAVGRLAGGVAHDFNNLLTVICGFARMAMDRGQVAGEPRTWLEQVVQAGDRAAALTKQLLAFSRKQVLQPTVLDVDRVLSEMAPMLRRLIGEDIEMTLVPGTGTGNVLADRSQFEQIVLNLAVNARDAMPMGGRLRIETRNETLDEAWVAGHAGLSPGDYVLVSVTDDGVGMSPETLSRIFEPFFTTKELGSGTGLGLATIYGIVSQSEGHVAVESAVGEGTTFRVYLPRIDSTESARRPETGAQVGGPETVLLVEDDDGVRGLTAAILTEAGYRVIAAESGPAALDRVCAGGRAGERIDLVLTDMVMPRMNGRQLVDRLGETHPRAAALFMSGYTDDAIVRHGVLEAGIDFLAKPFTSTTLLGRVRAALDRRR